MRRLLLTTSFFLLGFFIVFQGFSQDRSGIRTVVIDAGHGGKDPGAIGKKVQEKKITLIIALKLGALIKTNFPETKVIYTRSTDVFVELHERAGIANRNKADLFISIHCNANRSKVFRGTETYVMGLHKSAANLSIAKMENSSILMEPDYAVNYDGFDPNSDESYITFTLFQNIYLDQSTHFASIIQEHLTERAGIPDRGVRQAGFMVLYKTTMPSVLVETGFLSNPEEEAFLNSEKGQDYIASAIFKAFRSFKNKMGGIEEKEEKTEKELAAVDAPLKEKNKPTTPIVNKNDTDNLRKTPLNGPNKGVSFRVQIYLSPKPVSLTAKRFSGLDKVKMYKHQGMYKYTTGDARNLDDALRLLQKLLKKGYKDAFVVAFNGDARITIEQAKSLQPVSKQSGSND